MTRQIYDTLTINGIKHNIVAATCFDYILNIKSFGFEPKPMDSCNKGFYVNLLIEDNILKLDNLNILDKNDNYPIVNDVKAVTNSNYKEYKNVNLNINYTGHIYTASHTFLEGRMEWNWNLALEACDEVIDFYFENGILININEINNLEED